MDEDGINDDDDDDFYTPYWGSMRSAEGAGNNWYPKITEPQPAGVKLLRSGDFGKARNRLGRPRNSNIYSRLRRMALQPRAVNAAADLKHNLIPNTHGTAVAAYDSNIYVAQFSPDASFYYTCGQDFWMNVYDMKTSTKRDLSSNIPDINIRQYEDGHISTMNILKSFGVMGQWCITDSHLSSDNERIIYSSMSPTVFMAHTHDTSMTQTALQFGEEDSLWRSAIWSCKFSADGKEVFAGGPGPIYVYDLIANRRSMKISRAHSEDVNSVCWADTASGNVLISGSDDGFVKVWDRRSLGTAQRPSGVLVGHTEGITYVSSKGDGRYVISNGKDQALRLWDLRKMRSGEEQGLYLKPRVLAHPKDCSVMTYRGHAVLRTLIRCYFSPVEMTGGQYLYSGSYDGRIHIWSLDGTTVQTLDRSQTLPMACDPSAPEPDESIGRPLLRTGNNKTCVRDVSWHPQEPVLMSAGWAQNSRTRSTVARHEWKGLHRGGKLEDWVEKQRLEAAEMGGGDKSLY
ncbi:WD40-repeat-containing domain protein [Thelephora terrestris]|uniref:WD40-repeat-containing domain protein n=1 Tax=Thelephora terrestris TaxID=56493 RepID=A0A9P6L8S2_9AGAM|nr:WD40-repeat-containing domain protein [Thelephora terrestris]